MYHQSGLNVNLNFGNQGIRAGGCHRPGPFGGPRGPRGPQGQMMRMMQMMLQLMSRMMGQGQQGHNHHCCPHSRPSFGTGMPFPGGGAGIQFNAGASIRGFLG